MKRPGPSLYGEDLLLSQNTPYRRASSQIGYTSSSLNGCGDRRRFTGSARLLWLAFVALLSLCTVAAFPIPKNPRIGEAAHPGPSAAQRCISCLDDPDYFVGDEADCLSQNAYGCLSQNGDDTPAANFNGNHFELPSLNPLFDVHADVDGDRPPPLEDDPSDNERAPLDETSDESDDDMDMQMPDWIKETFKDAERMVGLSEPRAAPR